MKFIIATNNLHKLEELKRILLPLGIDAVTAKQAGITLEDVEETGITFSENAELKARAACKLTSMPAIADDSGLCVDALDGAPGVYSARYAGEGATDKDRIEKLLANMKDVPQEKRGSHFACAVCCVFPNGDIIHVQGETYGTIGYEIKGTKGFGYDPVFVSKGEKTFAEMTPEEKDVLSHRGKALEKLTEELKNYLERGLVC